MTGLPPHPVSPPASPQLGLHWLLRPPQLWSHRGACPLTHSLVTRDKGCKQPGGKFESTQSHQPTAAARFCPHSSAQQASRAGGSLRGSGPPLSTPPTNAGAHAVPAPKDPLNPSPRWTKAPKALSKVSTELVGMGERLSFLNPSLSQGLLPPEKTPPSRADPEPPILGLRDSL